jgi:hypothetical protein
MTRRTLQAGLSVARALWRAAPRPLRDALGLRIGARLRDGLAAGVRAQPWAPPQTPSPIVVSAFFTGVTGVAAAGRATAEALEAAGLQVIRHDLGALLGAGGFQAHDLPGEPDGVWLLHANPPEAKLALARLRAAAWERRYRIGYWAWELPRAPADWLHTAAGFHEVWAPSAFVRDSLQAAPTRLVLRPHPAPDVSAAAGVAPPLIEPAPNGAVFLAMADLKSGFRRKNPLGAVQAFTRAFPTPSAAVTLVVKLHSAGADPQALGALRAAAAGRDDIRLLDAPLAHAQALALIGRADVLLSLHRAEGFGLPIAEALALGRAVLATGWSGSETLLAEIPQARLPFTLTPVLDPGGPYDDPSQSWAEPDLDAAAARIAALAADPAQRAAIAAAGAHSLRALNAAWTAERLHAEPWAAAVSSGAPRGAG